MFSLYRPIEKVIDTCKTKYYKLVAYVSTKLLIYSIKLKVHIKNNISTEGEQLEVVQSIKYRKNDLDDYKEFNHAADISISRDVKLKEKDLHTCSINMLIFLNDDGKMPDMIRLASEKKIEMVIENHNIYTDKMKNAPTPIWNVTLRKIGVSYNGSPLTVTAVLDACTSYKTIIP